MKIFIDANVLVSVLNKEYPAFLYTSRVLSMADNKKYKLFTSSVCLAIAYYFAEKKHGANAAKYKISILLEHIEITDCGKKEAQQAIADKKVLDFEDGLQYYSAYNNNCRCIVTADTNDFHFSQIEVLEPEVFLRKYF
jgi:predicted nucleic acid-binding protein